MKLADQQLVLVDNKPVLRIRLTVWGVVRAAYQARLQLEGWRRLLWPLVCTIVFFVGLTRRTQDIPLHGGL